MITIVETVTYQRRAAKVLKPDEAEAALLLIASHPAIGDLLVDTGGIRKVRIAASGRGKSGGARVIYYYHDDEMPVFLLTVFAKNEKDNLTKAERHALAGLAEALRDSYRSKR